MAVTLICMLVEVGDVIGVKVDASEPVIGLKNLIKAAAPDVVRCEALRLELFLAKRGGLWLKSGSEDVKAMRNGDIPDTIMELMRDHIRMDDTYLLVDDEYFGTNFQPGGREIHVLVELPSATQRLTTFRSSAARMKSRFMRWAKTNECLGTNKKVRKRDGGVSTAYSDTKWSDLAVALRYEDYEQQTRKIPDSELSFLHKYLTGVAKALGGFYVMEKEAKVIHMVAPVLIRVCNLVENIDIKVEEAVNGNRVRAHGQFEFVITCRSKKICVVEAKKHDLDQGAAQALVGCEVVADVEDLHVVYGLVTDFSRWRLFRCGEENILMNNISLETKLYDLDISSLRRVCDMIYGALSTHEEENQIDRQLAIEEIESFMGE